MTARDALAFAARALTTERRRTFLALLGTSIGVGAVLVMVALGEGALRLVRAQFDVLGPNVMAIVPGKSETSGALPGLVGAPRDLTLEDAEALRRAVASAERLSPIVMGNDELSVGDRARRVIVLGATAELLAIRRLEVRSGSFLPVEPWDRGAPVIVLGEALVGALFQGENPLNHFVHLGRTRLRVIGVLASQGTHFGVDLDQTVMVPVATAMRLFDQSSLDRIALQARPGFDLERVEERCRAILLERHGAEDFTLTTPDAVLEAFEGILGVLTLALAAIASISLVVAGIGIMNVMLVSVSERTGEIGLLRALGASKREVGRLFLFEAGLISASGGLLGLALGWALVRSAARWLSFLPAAIPAWAGWVALLLALSTGLVSGILPALRAVRLDPVVALSGRRR
ncbi:MAG: FtsX-like permease family protein [Planctomycetes bacterium]|nr:FtsX-like permease family protein [Planctomycetota bacterium]